MSNVERRVVPVSAGEVRAKREDGKVGIGGMAAVFNSRTDLGPFEEEIREGAFTKALKRSDPRSLFNHDPNFVLGRVKSGTLTVRATEDGLSYEVPELPQARMDVAEMIERGDVDGNSFSFTVKTDEWTRREDGKDLRTIIEIDELYDVGPVTFPAYTDTSVALRSRDRALGEVAVAVGDLETLKLRARLAE
jgi:hypothetical protein